MRSALLIALIAAALVAGAFGDAINLSTGAIKVTHINDRPVQSDVVRQQIWIQFGKVSTLRFRSQSGNLNGYALSLQTPWETSSPVPLAPCDGTQTVTAWNSHAISCTGSDCSATIDTTVTGFPVVTSAAELYVCISSGPVTISLANQAMPHWFTIDSLFSLWIVASGHTPVSTTATHHPCVCSITCTVRMTPTPDCAALELYGPVAPPTESTVLNFGGVQKGWTPPNTAYGSANGFVFGIPKLGTANPDWWMPVMMDNAGVYATRGPFHSAYRKNGGWTVSFVSAASCGLGATAGTVVWSTADPLNWYPDNRTSVTFGTTSHTISTGTLGWVRINANVASSAGLLCFGVSGTGATPNFQAAGGSATSHDFSAVSTAAPYRVQATSVTLSRFGGPTSGSDGIVGVAGAPQHMYSPGKKQAYATEHVNVEVDFGAATFDVTDTPSTVNGATVLVSLQKSGSCSDPLEGTATPTFVEVRAPSSHAAAGTAPGDLTRKAFARLYFTQLSESWVDMTVCYAVVPVWYHRFNRFGTQSFYGKTSGATYAPSSPGQIYFPTPDVASPLETATPSLFQDSGKKFTVIPHQKVCRVETFGRRTGESCNAVGLVDGEGNQGIPLTTTCSLDGDKIGTYRFADLVDIVLGIAVNDQCQPFTGWGAAGNALYPVQRVPQRAKCIGTSGRSCTWSALQSCNYADKWLTTAPTSPCYGGRQSFTGFDISLAASGLATGQIQQLDTARMCVAIVPKMATDAGWHASGFDYNDMVQASKFHRKLHLNMLDRTQWSAVSINNVPNAQVSTTGAIVNQEQVMPVSVKLNGYNSATNCALNAFQVYVCLLRGTFTTGSTPSASNMCETFTAAAAGRDCALVWGCSEGSSASSDTFYGFMRMKATAAGEAIVCAQVSSSYGFDATNNPGVANVWNPTSSLFDANWKAKSPFTPAATSNLFYAVEKPTIERFGGVAPTSTDIVGIAGEVAYSKYVPVDVDVSKTYMPRASDFTITSGIAAINTARTTGTVGNTRVPVVDLAVTITSKSQCSFDSITHYDYTTSVDTFVARSMSKNWANTFTTYTSDSARQNFPSMAMIRPNYKVTSAGRAAHGPAEVNGNLCVAWIPTGFTLDEYATSLGAATTTQHMCKRAINAPWMNYETTVKARYSQVNAPARLNFIRDTCGSIGTKNFKIPVFAYDASGNDITGKFQNVSIYVSLQEDCEGQLPPLNSLAATNTGTSPYPYTLYGGLATADQRYQSIAQDTLAYPTKLTFDSGNGRLYYESSVHHYVSTAVCAVVAPSWKLNTPVSTGNLWNTLFTTAPTQTSSIAYGIDKDGVYTYRLTAADFNDISTRDYPAMRLQKSGLTGTTNIAQGATRFSAIPPHAVPGLIKFAGNEVNRNVKVYVPSVSYLADPTDTAAIKRTTLFGGIPRFSLEFNGGLQNEVYSVDTNYQLIPSTSQCGTVTPWFESSYADRRSIPNACCNQNTTMYNYASVAYAGSSDASSTKGSYVEFPLTTSFAAYNNRSNELNETVCMKVCRSLNPCGEIPSAGNFTDLVSSSIEVDVCIVPERKVRTQQAHVPPQVVMGARIQNCFNFTNDNDLIGLTPYVSFQTSATCNVDWTTAGNRFATPIPLTHDVQRGWCLNPDLTNSNFWTDLRSKAGTCMTPCFTAMQANLPIGGTENANKESVVAPEDFIYAANLRKAAGIPEPTCSKVYAPTCNEYELFLKTKLPPSASDCTAFRARTCPTVINMFGKEVTGPRLLSLSDTCNAIASNVNMATLIGEGDHNITINGYNLDRMTTWVSIQPVTKGSQPCNGKNALTGISRANKVTLNRDCSAALMTTDMWGRSYDACTGQQYGTFTATVAASDMNKEFAVCVAFLPEQLTPLAADFNNHLDTFQQQIATDASANSCPMTTCAHPISLHVTTIARERFGVKCVGSCSEKVAYAPSAARSQLPINVVRSALSGVAVPEYVQPDIWVSLEPYHPNRAPCRGEDILTTGTPMCQTHTTARMTRYYPIRVEQGFSDYNPGFATAPTSWGAVSGNYSLTLDALRTPEDGNYTLCYAVLSNGVVPQAKYFTPGYFASTPSCSLNLVKTSPNVHAGETNLNVCAEKPRGFIQGIASNLDTYVSLQSSKRCDSVMSVVRGSDESYVKVSSTPENGRYYYTLPKRSQVYTATTLTVCVAQVACGALPTPFDFRPAANNVELRVIQPQTVTFPSAGLATYNCDPTTSTCTSANVGFHACKEKSTDTTNTCVYAAAGCPVARCAINGACGYPAVPVQIMDTNGLALYEGCNIRVTSTNKKNGGFVNVTNGFLQDGIFNYSNYYQNAGEECNSFYIEADCGCGTNYTAPTPFSVKTQVATSVEVPAWPSRLFMPAANDVKTRYQVGYNSSLERTTALIANVLDANKVNMVGDVLSTATLTAVTDACTVADAKTNPNCAASTCISIVDNVAKIGVPGPAGAFNFLSSLVNPLTTSTASCNVRLLVTFNMKRCALGTDEVFYAVSPTMTAETLSSRWSQVVARQPTNAPNATTAPIPVTGDAAYATPAPPVYDPAVTIAPGATNTPVPTASPYEHYSAGSALAVRSVPTISSVPTLATNFGFVTDFQVCPGRHADKCATTLAISMMFNGPAVRKNDGSGSNPQLLVRFPVTGDEGATLKCQISHASGAVTIVDHKGFNVAPASATWDASMCELTVNMGCSQVTGKVSFTVSDFTFEKTGDPGVYPSVMVRDRSYDLTSPPNVVLYAENVNPTCDEVGPIVDNFDVSIQDDSCSGRANLEVCFTTTNEVQTHGGVHVDFKAIGSNAHFTHATGDVSAVMTKMAGQTQTLSNVSATWTAASGSNAARLTVYNRGTQCWAPGMMCFKVNDFVIPSTATTNPGKYCAATFTPSGAVGDQMMLTSGERCVDAASDVVNSITDLKVTTPADRHVGDLNFPLSFAFTLSQGLAAQECITIDVPYFKNNQPVVPLYTGKTTSVDSDVAARTGRYMDLIDGVSMIRSEESANPARFFKATYTNNAGCGGKLQLCTSCAIGGGSANNTNFCTRLSFQVDNFYAPSDDTCTQASLAPFSSKGRLVDWKVTTPALTNNAYDAETVYARPILGGAKLQITQTYAGDTSKFPYNRYAREAHAAFLSLFFTVQSTQSLSQGDKIKITFPCEESKKYFCDSLHFESSPSAYCKAGQTCSHSCLQAPTCDNTNNVVSVTVTCPIEAGTLVPFTLAPFTSPVKPAKKEDLLFQLNIETAAGVAVDSAKDVVALTHDVEGIADFNVKTSSCVAGAATTLTVGMSLSRTITNGAIVIVFPDNTYHPSYSTLDRTRDGTRPLGQWQVEGLIPLTVSTAFAGEYEAYWRNQTFEYWSDNVHDPNMQSNRGGDREQALVIYPKNNRRFTSTTINLAIEGLVNPWKRSWDTASFNYNSGTHSTNTGVANTNPSGAYRGNWQFKRVEYRADAYNADGSKKSSLNWFNTAGDNLHVHLPLLRTQEWYNANRATRRAAHTQLNTLYTPAPQPYWNPTTAANIDLNYPTLATAADYAKYATESTTAALLTPAGAATGIRDLSVVPSTRTIGSKDMYLTVKFRTCVSLGRSGRIDIQFGVQEPKDNKVLTGSLNDVEMVSDYRDTVTAFTGRPFTMAKEGPVSVEDGNVAGKKYSGYFRKVWGSGVQQAGGVLSITGLDQFDCGVSRSDEWTFVIGKDFGSFTTSDFPYAQALPQTSTCFDPGFYQIATYTMGCSDAPATCGGAGNLDRRTCGETLLELSTYMNPTTDELSDDTIEATTAFVDITGDKRLGQRMPCTIDSTLRFTAKFRKQVKEGDTLKFVFPANSFRHTVDATVTETTVAGYRPLLKQAGAWNAATNTLTVTFDRSYVSCARLSGGECITFVDFTVDGFQNPVRSGSIGNMTASLTVAAGTFTTKEYEGVKVESLQFTATLTSPMVNSISDMLFEFPSMPCNVAPGDKIKVKMPSAFTLQAGPLVAVMPTAGTCTTPSTMTATTSGQDLILTVPSSGCAACGINNCRRLMHGAGEVGLQGRRKCDDTWTKTRCLEEGCTFDTKCRDGNMYARTLVENFVVDSQLTQTMTSGFRVLVQGAVKNPAKPGDPGKYELTVTDSNDATMLWSGSINPSDENVPENTDLVHGIDQFDIKPHGTCTWCDSRDGRSVALAMSFVNYGAHRFAAPGSSASKPVNSPYNTFTLSSLHPAGMTYDKYSTGTDFSMWREGTMHQIEVCFPNANFSYTYLGRGADRLKRTYDPISYFEAATTCTTDKETDWTIPVQFVSTPKYNDGQTTHIPIDADWYTTSGTGVTRYAKIEGAEASRVNNLFAAWTSDRCVLIETYEDVVGGKYTFVLGEESNNNGFTQGTPLSADAMSGNKVEFLGPKDGIIRNNVSALANNEKYTVTLRNRYDDQRDASSNVNTDGAKFAKKQCKAPVQITSVQFVPPTDMVCSGIADFDVVPSKASAGAEDVWLTFSMTVNVAMSQASGMDVVFPPASFYRPQTKKCGFSEEEIPVEVLSHTQLGTASAYSSRVVATARWIINPADYKNEQTSGRDLNAGRLRLNFTRTDSWQPIEAGYIVFRVGGFVNPNRIGDPSRPTAGPYAQPAEYWVGHEWYNNARVADWRVEVYEYSFGDKNTRTLSLGASTAGTATCTNTLAGGVRTSVVARGSMNAPSDWIGTLYCGPQGIKIGENVRAPFTAFDVVPSRNSINNAGDEQDITLEFSMCVRRDVPAGSRIVIRLPEDSFTAPSCGRSLEVTSDDSHATGFKTAKAYVDNGVLSSIYDAATSDPYNAEPTKELNTNAATNYGFNRYEPGLASSATSGDELFVGAGSYAGNSNGAYTGRTLTVIVGEGGVMEPERPKWYDMSATNTLTATKEDQFGSRGPTGVRLFTFKVSGFQAPCSVKTHTKAVGTYASQDLATGDLGEYDVRVEYGAESLLALRNKRVAPCTDSTLLNVFTMKDYYTSLNDALWTNLRNGQTEALYPHVEVLMKASEHPMVLQARNDVSPARKSNFALSPSNPPSDAVWGITEAFNFNFELKILNKENDRQCGSMDYNKAGSGSIDPSKYQPGSNQRVQFSLELPSCFVSRSQLATRPFRSGVKANENDGDKLTIKFPKNTYQHKCGKVDLSNVPNFYEAAFQNQATTPVSSAAVDPWAGVAANLGKSYVRITGNNNDATLVAAGSRVVELVSAEWNGAENELNVLGPLADWRIAQPKEAPQCGKTTRHVVKFEACCFQLPENFEDPGAFAISYKKRTKRDEDMVTLLSQTAANPKCDAVPNPASCQSMWGGCGSNMKECTTGTGVNARCVCIPDYAECCNATHGFDIDRSTGLYAGNTAEGVQGGVRAYCDKFTETCASYEDARLGKRCSKSMNLKPRARAFAIAMPTVFFFTIVASLVIVIFFVREQLGSIIAPLILSVLICGFSSVALLSVEFNTALGFAFLAIFNIFAAHPESNSKYMLVCLIVEGLMLLSFFSTAKVIPTQGARALLPVYADESACIAFYGHFGVDAALVKLYRDSPSIVGRRLCTRSFIMTLDLMFVLTIACFVLLWFVNLYFYVKQRENEAKERRERRSQYARDDMTVRTLNAQSGEPLPPADEVQLENEAVN